MKSLMSLVVGGSLAMTASAAEPMWVYIGTYTSEGGSEGIYRAAFDAESGQIGAVDLVAEMTSPSFLEISPSKRSLYAVSESGPRQGVHSFAIDPESGALTKLNERRTGGGAPCHVAVDPTGRTVAAANYSGGSVRSFPTDVDGRLGGPGSFFQHEGSSVNPRRQNGPHGHSVNFSPDGRFVFVADLGLDEIKIYRANHETGRMVPHFPAAVKVAPGAGPRHFVFHPSGRFAYVINEMHMTVTAFSYDAEKGVLKEIETVSTVPGGKATKGGSTAEVRVHPNGRFLYGSNRGHDTIAVYRIDEASGRLTLVENEGEGIRTPRNFNLDPTGKWCLVANQNGGSVAVFSVDQESGELAATGHSTKVDKPVCVRFLPEPGFVSLFTGTFDGWEGNLEYFRIEDGAIVAGKAEEKIPRNEFLVSERSYKDFELRLEAKLTGEGTNAGVQFWSERIPEHHEMKGYQCDIGTGGSWGVIWGWLYDESRRRKMLTDPDKAKTAEAADLDDWNELRVLAQGNRIQIWLNGYRTVDYTETDDSVPRNGRFGLQIHSGPPAECRYRNIRLKRL